MPVNSMARPASSAAAITSSSRIEPPGWITAVAPASTAASKPSANGKKASEATAEPTVRGSAQPFASAASSASDRGDARAVAAVHLAGADAGGDAVLGIDDRVRLDVLGDGPGEQAVGDFLLGRLALRHAFELVARDHAIVAVLDQDAAGDHRDVWSAARRIGQLAGQQQAQVLLSRENRLGLLVGIGRDDDLGEISVIASAVAASSGRLLATIPPNAETLSQASASFHASSRLPRVATPHGLACLTMTIVGSAVAELGDQLERRIGVVEIVVAELLALDLLCLGDAARRRPDRQIERRLLVRVLAVAERHLQLARRRVQVSRPALALVGEREPLRDRRIVGGGQRIGLGGKPLRNSSVVRRRWRRARSSSAA